MRSAVAWPVLVLAPAIILTSCSVAEYSSDVKKPGCGVTAPESRNGQATPQRSAADVDVRIDGVDIHAVVDVRDAREANRGKDYAVAFDDLEDAFSDDYVAPDVESVDENCQLNAVRTRAGDDPVADFQKTVGVFDRNGFSAVADTSQEQGPWQSIGEGWAGTDFYWLETSSTNLEWEDWRLMRSKGGTGSPEGISSSVEYFGTDVPPPISGGYTTISVNDQQIAWNTSEPGSGRPTVLVRDRHGIREHGDGAWLHSADEDAVFYVQPLGEKLAEGGGKFAVIRVGGDGSKNETVLEMVLPEGRETVSQVAVHGDTVAFTVPARMQEDGLSKTDAQIYVVDLATKSAIVIQTGGDGADTASLDVGDEFLVFGNGSSNGDAGQYVLDIDALELLHVGDAEGRGYIGTDGDVISWTIEAPSDRLGVRVAKFVD